MDYEDMQEVQYEVSNPETASLLVGVPDIILSGLPKTLSAILRQRSHDNLADSDGIDSDTIIDEHMKDVVNINNMDSNSSSYTYYSSSSSSSSSDSSDSTSDSSDSSGSGIDDLYDNVLNGSGDSDDSIVMVNNMVEHTKKKIKNLVIGGGGTAGYCYVGAVIRLFGENDGYELNTIKNFVGTSIGSLIVTILSMSDDTNYLKNVLSDFDVTQVKDNNFGIIRNAYRTYKKFGMCKGEYVIKKIREVLEELSGRPHLTFKEHYGITKRNLVITAVNVATRQTVYFNRLTHPDLEIAMAIRSSMSLPLIFIPVELENTHFTNVFGKKGLYIDGGISDNYPIKFLFTDMYKLLNTDVCSIKKKDVYSALYQLYNYNVKDNRTYLIEIREKSMRFRRLSETIGMKTYSNKTLKHIAPLYSHNEIDLNTTLDDMSNIVDCHECNHNDITDDVKDIVFIKTVSDDDFDNLDDSNVFNTEDAKVVVDTDVEIVDTVDCETGVLATVDEADEGNEGIEDNKDIEGKTSSTNMIEQYDEVVEEIKQINDDDVDNSDNSEFDRIVNDMENDKIDEDVIEPIEPTEPVDESTPLLPKSPEPVVEPVAEPVAEPVVEPVESKPPQEERHLDSDDEDDEIKLTFRTFCSSIVSTLMDNGLKQTTSHDILQRTIAINVGNVSTTKLKIDQKTIDKMLMIGADSASDFMFYGDHK
jgi:predicted patatin/cPLA2 family phospholipase